MMKRKPPAHERAETPRAAADPDHDHAHEAPHPPPERPDPCERIERRVNDYLHEQRSRKRNAMPPCEGEEEECPCSRPGGAGKAVDLVVLLDSSGSMGTAGKAASDAAEDAVAAAARECPSDLRVVWLVVDSTKSGADPAGYLGDITPTLAGTPFTQSHEQYLTGIGAGGPFKQNEPQPAGDTTYPGEEGADSIADLCNFFDWRRRACKAILYISDTRLDGYSAFDAAAAANASAAALARGVVLFAHHIGAATPVTPEMQNYSDMCLPTGGSVYFGPVDTDKYRELIKNAICNACGAECREARLPRLEPCVSLSWGDSECDCFETDDVETALITICNCYSNVGFSGVRVAHLSVTLTDGSPVPLLPDGTPSVTIHPIGPVCFGDIGPCREGEVNCVSREIVIRTRGARSGGYRIEFEGICYDVVLPQSHRACFGLTLCGD
jgi:hypothetical protein